MKKPQQNKQEERDFKHLLGCPLCKSSLTNKEDSFLCEKCNKIYTTKYDVPIFLDQKKVDMSAMAQHQKKIFSFKKFLRIFRPDHHSVYFDTLKSSHGEERNLIKFLKDFHEKAFIVNVGSLSRKIKKIKARIINLDISFYPNIDVVADAHKLPFKDKSLDGIIIKNVFEHLQDPVVVREEIQRVLKKGGRVYAKVPFLQPFHAVPHDYQRWTIYGLREFFKDFKQLDEGISVGPSSSLSWFLSEYLGILFSFNSDRGYRLAKTFFSYFTYPIKYLDIFFYRKKQAHRLASAFYMILEKKD